MEFLGHCYSPDRNTNVWGKFPFPGDSKFVILGWGLGICLFKSLPRESGNIQLRLRITSVEQGVRCVRSRAVVLNSGCTLGSSRWLLKSMAV